MIVEVINNNFNGLPEYKSEYAAGLDVRANITDTVEMAPNSRLMIPTGLKVAIPKGYEIQVRPRSGFAIKEGITVLNTPGTIN